MQAHIWLVNSSSYYINWSQLLSDWSALALISLVSPTDSSFHFTLVLGIHCRSQLPRPVISLIIHISPAPALIGRSQLLSHWSGTARLMHYRPGPACIHWSVSSHIRHPFSVELLHDKCKIFRGSYKLFLTFPPNLVDSLPNTTNNPLGTDSSSLQPLIKETSHRDQHGC